MELSRLDFKKYQTILNFKHQINNVPPKHILSESTKISNKQVDEYGEIAVSHLEQTRREFNENELKEISSLYQSGKTTREIGEIFGVCKTTIVKLLREQGVEVTRSKVQAKLNAEEVISLYKNGYTSGKIAVSDTKNTVMKRNACCDILYQNIHFLLCSMFPESAAFWQCLRPGKICFQ